MAIAVGAAIPASTVPAARSIAPLVVPGWSSLMALGYLEQHFSAQTYLAGRVDVDHFDQDLLAFFQLIAHVLDPVVCDF